MTAPTIPEVLATLARIIEAPVLLQAEESGDLWNAQIDAPGSARQGPHRTCEGALYALAVETREVCREPSLPGEPDTAAEAAELGDLLVRMHAAGWHHGL
jgi:hypothetical protein